MTEFRTIVTKKEFPFHINHQHAILCIGSCFAEHMGERLSDYQFTSMLNPFGILYNPVSICDGLNLLLKENNFLSEDLFNHQGLWHSFQHHGRFSGPDQATVLEHLNAELKSGRAFLQKTNRLILTLGTAYAYRNKDSQMVVANCHKLPANQFERQLLSLDDCVLALSQTLNKLRLQRPDLEVILSVSPIRHLRDGLIQNQRSKASLLLAAADLENKFPFVHYFPSYEIIMDDLRDYRFYESDLSHPNLQAIDYIWNYFQNAFFEEETKSILKEVGKIIHASKHRPFHPESKEHQGFLRNQLALINKLKAQYSFLDLNREKLEFERQLI